MRRKTRSPMRIGDLAALVTAIVAIIALGIPLWQTALDRWRTQDNVRMMITLAVTPLKMKYAKALFFDKISGSDTIEKGGRESSVIAENFPLNGIMKDHFANENLNRLYSVKAVRNSARK